MPATQFKHMKELLIAKDPTVYESTVDGETILVSRKSCAFLENQLDDIQFQLATSLFVIKPKGYLYSLNGQDDCFIGVQSIHDDFNQYRLGTVFLRNFYTVLDFDKNLVLMGLNNDLDTA